MPSGNNEAPSQPELELDLDQQAMPSQQDAPTAATSDPDNHLTQPSATNVQEEHSTPTTPETTTAAAPSTSATSPPPTLSSSSSSTSPTPSHATIPPNEKHESQDAQSSAQPDRSAPDVDADKTDPNPQPEQEEQQYNHDPEQSQSADTHLEQSTSAPATSSSSQHLLDKAPDSLPEIPDEIPEAIMPAVQIPQPSDQDEVEAETSISDEHYDHAMPSEDFHAAAAAAAAIETGMGPGGHPQPMPSMLANATIPLEEDASGDLSTSSNETLTLTSTVSRGNYHQCGSARRVKVYELKGETWFDRGTGYCAGVYDETVDEALLVARKEDKCQFLESMDMQADPDLSDPMLNHQQNANGTSAVDSSAAESKPEAEAEQAAAAGQPGDSQQGGKGRPCQFVVVVSENLDSDDILLASKVVKEEVYQRQQETLVVWTEPTGTDMALSFQEAEGCNEVWEFLTEVQKHFMGLAEEALSDSPPTTPNPHSPSGALGMSGSAFGMDSFLTHEGAFTGLPDPELGNLEAIEMILKDAATRSPFMREKVALWLLREDYIKKLIPVFDDAEELEALPSLHLLCVIMQTILMLNDNVIFEYILQDDVFLGVVGMLEYDPEFPSLKAGYREYLRDKARFKQVIEIGDPTIVAKIHQTYRLLYLKDVILARVLDDPTFSILNSFVFFHQSDIVNYCCQNDFFLGQLFTMLLDPNESCERKAEGVFFLQQLCSMGKQIQLPARLALYRTLTETGLLGVLQETLNHKSQAVRNASAEILMTIIEYDASSVRAHVVAQVDHGRRPLMSMLIDLLHTESDLGLKAQVAEAMRIIFDVGEAGPMGAQAQAQALAAQQGGMGGMMGADKVKTDSDRFLTWIYDSEIGRLCSPFNQLPDSRVLSKGEKLAAQPRARSALYGHLCDLLCYMMTHHSFRSQYFVLTSEISRKVASLLHAREKHVRLSALRFFKHCLMSNNQFTNRHFVKIELFSTLLGLVESEADRNNMISSACLDFFEHIRRENMKTLINHCMERHFARIYNLRTASHVGPCFDRLISDWEKNVTGPSPETAVENASGQQTHDKEEKLRQQRDLAQRGANRSNMDVDEESYFNAEDEEGTSAVKAEVEAGAAANHKGGLVPYGDEDEAEAEGVGRGETGGAETDDVVSPPRVAEKRRREEEEEEEADVVGRLAKRKSGKVKADSEADEAGVGFIRSTNANGRTTRSSEGGKKIALGLSSSSKRMAAQNKGNGNGSDDETSS